MRCFSRILTLQVRAKQRGVDVLVILDRSDLGVGQTSLARPRMLRCSA
jgi:hypothetical protein